MGAIVLEANKVNSYVLPGFEKASSYVQKAYDASENLKKYLSGYNVSGIVNDLYNIKKEITNTKNLVINKISKAKQIESKSESKVSSIASKMASTAGAVTGAIMGAKTGLVGTAIGAVAGSAVGKKAGKTIADTGAKVAKETKSLGTKIWGGIKNVGSKVASGFKSAADWVGDKVTSAVDWIGNAASDVGNWVSDKFNAAKDWTCEALENTGAWISNAASATWSWLKGASDTVWTHMKKIGASIANAVISLVEGVVRLVESIGDLFLLLGTCVDTIGTGIVDIVNGISTGNWGWKNTKELWNTCKTMVAYDWTSKIFEEGLYTTGFGKWLDNNAYAPFKSDALGCKICQGIGYIAGIVVISIFTFGAGGAAIGATATIGSTTISATSVAIVAAGAGIGKYTQEEWNKNCLAISYDGENEIGLSINYEKYREITNLKPGQSTSLVQTFTDENGESYDIIFNITANEDGTYNIIDSDGNTVQFNGVKESSTIKGLLVGTGKGLYDGFKAYTAVSAVGNIQSFAGMVKEIGAGSYIKGGASLLKNFGVKQSLKPLATQAAKATFKDAGFYIQSGTALYGDVKSGIETGEWDPLKMAAHVGLAYANNFVGNLAGGYFQNGLSTSIGKIQTSKMLDYKNSIGQQLDDIDLKIAEAEKLGDYDAIETLRTQKSQLNEQYYKTLFGADNVDMVDQVSHHIDESAIDTNKLHERYVLFKEKQSPEDPREPIWTALDEEGNVTWPPEDGYEIGPDGKAILQPKKFNVGDKIDRYGREYGRFVGLADENGIFPKYEEKSMPWREETNTLYNQYTITAPLDTDSLTEYIYKNDKLDEALTYMHSNGVVPKQNSTGKFIFEVNSGKIAPAYGLPGGGQQTGFPISIEMLKEWGFIGG